jgi:hypothetical protein
MESPVYRGRCMHLQIPGHCTVCRAEAVAEAERVRRPIALELDASPVVAAAKLIAKVAVANDIPCDCTPECASNNPESPGSCDCDPGKIPDALRVIDAAHEQNQKLLNLISTVKASYITRYGEDMEPHDFVEISAEEWQSLLNLAEEVRGSGSTA